MRQRGKKSADALATQTLLVRHSAPIPPPSELTDAQATVWRDVAGSLPSDFIDRGMAPVLVNYCRHVCRGRLLETLVARFEAEWITVDGGLERLDRLLGMAERESRAALACARALRLTPQSRMHPRTAGRMIDNNPPGPRPWDGNASLKSGGGE